MVDVVDQATRSRMMSGIKGKNTRPEILVRQFLHGHGFRYRLHSKSLPGSPDIVMRKWMVAVFVHGCFWHRHEGCRFSTSPDSNVGHWHSRFEENTVRDRRNISELVTRGWTVIILWECGLREVKAGKRNLLWLLDSIRTGHSTGCILEWPTVEGKLGPAHHSTISTVDLLR
ncbi:DNA mismatch endonuclease Vsr [Accumulibacter sp.]|uniref:very short patch repair endonuclease n=1 Tax=Accumulibacter sp. TaxID=2053492 RepID=UPI0028C4F70B|nr:DNA mismatch endonuclease Vsr [Accumulibacter sp.]